MNKSLSLCVKNAAVFFIVLLGQSVICPAAEQSKDIAASVTLQFHCRDLLTELEMNRKAFPEVFARMQDAMTNSMESARREYDASHHAYEASGLWSVPVWKALNASPMKTYEMRTVWLTKEEVDQLRKGTRPFFRNKSEKVYVRSQDDADRGIQENRVARTALFEYFITHFHKMTEFEQVCLLRTVGEHFSSRRIEIAEVSPAWKAEFEAQVYSIFSSGGYSPDIRTLAGSYLTHPKIREVIDFVVKTMAEDDASISPKIMEEMVYFAYGDDSDGQYFDEALHADPDFEQRFIRLVPSIAVCRDLRARRKAAEKKREDATNENQK